MTTLVEFRRNVQQELATDLDIRFVAGYYDGPSEEQDLGCVFVRGKREVAEDVNQEELHLGVRVFRQWKQTEGYTEDLSNRLEELAEGIQSSLADKVTVLGPWFFRVTELEILWEQAAVEATVVGWQQNLAVA